MTTFKDIFTFSKKPKSFDDRVMHMAATTPYSHEKITELMDCSGMNIDEAEIIVKNQHEFDQKDLTKVISNIKQGVYNWKELVNK